MAVVILRHSSDVAPPERQPASKEDFNDAVKHTFIHESKLNNVTSDFWTANTLNFPCQYGYHEFKGPIFSYPIEFKLNHTWVVRGIFCSPHCAKKYMSTHADVPTRCYTLFSLMMRMVYGWTGDVEPASDVDLLYNPLDPMTLEKWLSLPKAHEHVTLTVPQLVPFKMENRNVVSHVMSTHPAYEELKGWNVAVAEPGLPEETITAQDFEQDNSSSEDDDAPDDEAEEEDDVEEEAPKPKRPKKESEKKRKLEDVPPDPIDEDELNFEAPPEPRPAKKKRPPPPRKVTPDQ